MASHRDDDFGINDAVRKLFEQRAEELTERRANLITAGEPGEKEVGCWRSVTGMTIRQMPDDPLALRISIGEPHNINEGSYLVYRGDVLKVLELLRRATESLNNVLAQEELREENDRVVSCTVCGLRKKPIGRDAPVAMANSLCDHECSGYLLDPRPGTLWPGEPREEVT